MSTAVLRDIGTSPVDAIIARIIRTTRCIAIVGLSSNESRPSWGVARYLKSQGFRVVPVNPVYAGHSILDETVYPDLRSIPHDLGVDMVDIFRQSQAVPGIVEEAIATQPALRTVWMQLGISHPIAAGQARAQGLTVIEDRCSKIEFSRLR